jgi:hypothetical protein
MNIADATEESRMASVFCDEAANNARSIFANLGFRLAETPSEADLIWMRKGYTKLLNCLGEYQLLNHLPNELAITNKGFLTENLKRYDRDQSRCDFSSKDFYRETYCLYDPEERQRFFAQLPQGETPENLWIMKPTASSRGRGIKILWQFKDLKSRYEGSNLEQTEKNSFIIQRYIRNPLLLDGRKSEIRIYWLIASLRPLLVLMYKEGTVRLNSHAFRLEDFDNTLIHVTNVYQQKIHPAYDPSVILKWSFSDLATYLAEKFKLAGPNFIQDELTARLKRCLAYVVHSARGTLTEGPQQGLHFGLFGADVILDDTLRPWLTEIQKGPGLSYDDPVKKRLVPNMLGEAARIVLEIRKRKRQGESLSNLQAVHDFEWVIRDA